MKEFWNMVQMVFAAVGGWLGYFLGGNDGLLIALVLFAAVDYLTGVMCAVSDKTLSSNVGFKGICRKVLIFLLVGIANILDVHVIGTGSVLRTAVIGCRCRGRLRLSWNSSMTEPKKQKRRRNKMKLVQSILTKNPCYTAGRKITVKGLMLHSVGCPQPKASVFIKNWNSPSYDSACVHGFIDGNDGTVYQTLPWNHRGWHCGSGSKGSGNNTHIGVEMCEPACIKYTGGANFTCSDTAAAKAVAKRTYEAAVDLFAYLCRQYNLNPTADGVIISPREGHSRGIASNHGDPEHLWNGLGMGYTMDGFRKAVKAVMDGSAVSEPEERGWYRVRKSWADAKSQKGAFKMFANAKKSADENPGYSVYDESGKAVYSSQGSGNGFSPYLVQVSITDLNIRKGPGTNYGKTGKYTGKGVFTIVEEASGQGASRWGKLKSGAGWISLDYAKKI